MLNHPVMLNGTDFLYSDIEAENFNCAYPIGNGTLGAMVYGANKNEKLSLNHDCLWAGGTAPEPRKGVPETLTKVRDLISDGLYRDAQNLCEEKMLTEFNQPYLPAGDLTIDWHDTFNTNNGYQRVLSLEEGTAFVDNRISRRTYFVSKPHNVICFSVQMADGHRGNATFSLNSKLRHKVSNNTASLELEGETPANVVWNGVDDRAPDGGLVEYSVPAPRTFAVVADFSQHDGTLHHEDGRLILSDFSYCTVLVVIGVSDLNPSPLDHCRDVLSKQRQTTAAELFTDHYSDFSSYYNRVKFQLSANNSVKPLLPTERRIIERHNKGFDLDLDTLLFNIGRYLLISSSRAGSQPANLQGIWNESVAPPWWSNYTININTQMNYWPAEVCNLSELHEPMFRLIKELSIAGKETARKMYGTRGWVSHHQTDYRRQTTPVGFLDNKIIENCSQWAIWPMSGPWLCQHLIEHYRFTGDIGFLRDFAWPIMKGAAEFLLDWLIEDNSGQLTTAPSTSPENTYRNRDGEINAICSGSEMDLAIIREHFSSMLEAAEALGWLTDPVIEEIRAAIPLIPSTRINKEGRIMEWNEDWDEGEHPHRHISHLFGLFPGTQVSDSHSPGLALAARKALDFRGTGGTGWSLVWKAICWARLKEGNHTYLHINNLFAPISPQVFEMANDGGGIYPNMLLACPPLMLEANFGYSALVIEMLVQSHDGFIDLLPSIPDGWASGSISGVRLRSQIEISMEWENGQVHMLTLVSQINQTAQCNINGQMVDIPLSTNTPVTHYF